MRSYLFCILCFICLSGCSQKDKTEFNNVYKKFNEQDVSHFPKNDINFHLISQDFSFPDSSLKINMGVWLIERYSVDGNVDSIINNIRVKSIKICNHNDSCNLILPLRDLSNYTAKELHVFPCCDQRNIVPVPSFYEELFDLNIPNLSYLPDTYILYVLDIKPGKFICENLLLKEGCMPYDWVHGLSKGVAINKDNSDAIFWIEIW